LLIIRNISLITKPIVPIMRKPRAQDFAIVMNSILMCVTFLIWLFAILDKVFAGFEEVN
jgi:hypothetical protein